MKAKSSNRRQRALRSLSVAFLTMLVALSYASTADAAEATWSFDPAGWDFGTVVPGTGPTAPKAFTLTNTGEVELHPFFVSVGGEGGSGFALAGDTCGDLPPVAAAKSASPLIPPAPEPSTASCRSPARAVLLRRPMLS
jgi:hypothetical protein